MIVEERIYTCHPGKAAQFVKVYEAEGLKIQRPILGHLVGYFTTEFGPLNQVIHMWAYASLEDRTARRKTLMANQDWLAYIPKVQPFLMSQENKLLLPTPFSPWADGPAYPASKV